MSDLIDSRGEVYGHPRDHFARTLALVREVYGDTPVSELLPKDWAVVMICDKLARFAETTTHADSIADIAGYAECWLMCQRIPEEET